MDKLDENYLDLVRASLYNKQPKASTKHSPKHSKSPNKLGRKAGDNEESPGNIVKPGFETKKEVFKAKVKLQNQLKKKSKPKEVRFIHTESKNTPENNGFKDTGNKVKNRVATPYKTYELPPKLKVKSKSSNNVPKFQDTVSKIDKVSPTLHENDILVSFALSNQDSSFDLKQVSKKENDKGKKRLLSHSDSPEKTVKRKKDKLFAKKGKKLTFEGCFNDFESGTAINDDPDTYKKKKDRVKSAGKNLNANFMVDTSWVPEAETLTNNNTVGVALKDDEKKKTKKSKKKLKIGQIATNKADDKSQQDILELGSLHTTGLILENDLRSNIMGKSDHKNKKKGKKTQHLKLTTKGLGSKSQRNATKVLHSSASSSSPSDIEFESRESWKKSINIEEDLGDVSDSCDNKSVVVKGLKYQRFCNLYTPTHNEQFVGQGDAFRVPKKYFKVSKDDFESDAICEEIPTPKHRKSLGKQKIPHFAQNKDVAALFKEIPTTKHRKSLGKQRKTNFAHNKEVANLLADENALNSLEIIKSSPSGKRKKQKKKKIDILDDQILGNGSEDPISIDESTTDAEATLDSEENLKESDYLTQPAKEIENRKPERKPIIINLKNEMKIVVLNLDNKMYFHGLCQVRVLNGEIEILGARINSSCGEKKLYSPRGTSLLYIRNKDILRVENSVKLKQLVAEELLNEQDIELTFEQHHAIFLCSFLREPHIDFIEEYVAQKIFPEGSADELRVDFNLQGTWNRIQTSDTWEEVIENIPENSKIVICGGKAVGKSTFLRYAVNFMLGRFKKIRVIDLDPGQSEFCFPGCISVLTLEREVFGPNYTHLTEPNSCVLSHINMGYDIKKYLNSVKCLLKSTKSMEASLTLINFPGFTQGIGLDISAQTLKLIEPSLVIQIDSKTHSKNYKVDLTPENVTKTIANSIFGQGELGDLSYDLVKLNSLAESNEAWSLEARQGREMNILSYFGQLMSDSVNNLTSVTVNMYSINISALSITNLEGKAISPLAINANLVALCSILDYQSDIFSCYGYGFVRGIDLQTDTLVLITPEPIATLENVSHLVLGSVTTPPSLIMTAGGLKGHIPYVSVGEPVDFGQFTKRSYIPARKA